MHSNVEMRVAWFLVSECHTLLNLMREERVGIAGIMQRNSSICVALLNLETCRLSLHYQSLLCYHT